ncbi:hypothetical protein GLYMA_07G009400v4 [Glycine max]|uniref:Uncharacterized protein n=1 Tax=Glycine max TaxID=3847 RepID=K7KYY1_SOYBN|nr:hypothetical protein GYH30_017026 [Glycine max]KRH47112.1 hypothetical protein GLYMA_07G009400v4 [Glycine max]
MKGTNLLGTRAVYCPFHQFQTTKDADYRHSQLNSVPPSQLLSSLVYLCEYYTVAGLLAEANHLLSCKEKNNFSISNR